PLVCLYAPPPTSIYTLSPTRRSSDLAAFGLMGFDGLSCVIDDVEKDLLQLVRVHQRFGKMRVEPRDDLDVAGAHLILEDLDGALDRKSTRLNSSHVASSYAVFCLKKK